MGGIADATHRRNCDVNEGENGISLESAAP
jgi:hypothetical protein